MKTMNTMQMSFRWFTALAALTFGLTAGQAVADPTDNPPTVTISFSDLDLSKPAGAETLYQRIQAAARIVCHRSKKDARDLRIRRASRTCYKDAIDDALKQVNNSNLFEVDVAAR